LPLKEPALLQETLRKHADDIACIIVEPNPANNGLLIQDPSWLELLRSKATEHNVLLIFDEVISGFRVGFTGAAGYYNVQPDIITFGKVIGGGFPVGAYAASAEIMDNIAPVGPVYQAGTLSANPVAMAAGLAALELCLTPGFYELQAQKTHGMATAIEAYAKEKGYPLQVPHIGSIFWLAFGNERITRSDQIDAANMEYFKIIHHELLQTGVYLGPSGYEVGFVSGAHSVKDLEEAVTKICAAIDVAFG
jgi:glutamate-1-semialdehyde 2,1-aminomutase